jgi:AcrR family transcriptional regulator
MPTQTFLKLKPEKRQHIIDIALNFFALQDFEAVSITALMKELALPKGSFYQYFEDKRDLYFYLFEHLQQKKDTALAQNTPQARSSFFENWEDWLFAELQYHWQHPQEWRFWLNAYREQNSPALGNLQALILGRVAQQFLGTLRQESRQGNSRQDIPMELQAHFLAPTSDQIARYILHKFALSLEENIKQKTSLPTLPTIEVKIVIQQWLMLLQKGITNVVEK